MKRTELVDAALREYLGKLAKKGGADARERRLPGSNGTILEVSSGGARLAGLFGAKGASTRTTLDVTKEGSNGQGFRLNWSHEGYLCGIWFNFDDEDTGRGLLDLARDVLADVENVLARLEKKEQAKNLNGKEEEDVH